MAKEGERAGEPMRAEEALRESEEKYRNIFETAPDGIVTVDLKGIVTSCNSAFTSITGFSESEIVGKHFSKLPTLRARDIPKYMKMFNSLIRGNGTSRSASGPRRRYGTVKRSIATWLSERKMVLPLSRTQ